MLYENKTSGLHISVRLRRAATPGVAAFILCLLIAMPCAAMGPELGPKSDFESLYDPGIPTSASVEWSFPTGFSLGIDSGHQLRFGEEGSATGAPNALDTFPLSFMVKYNIFESYRLSQSIGVGVGPTFVHEGKMPLQFKDMDVTGNSTCATEWISHLSRDIYVNLKMKYTHAFQSVVNQIPLSDFTTWLGLNLRW